MKFYIDIFGEDNEHLIDLETIFLKNTKFNKIYSNNSFNFLNEDKINFEEINKFKFKFKFKF